MTPEGKPSNAHANGNNAPSPTPTSSPGSSIVGELSSQAKNTFRFANWCCVCGTPPHPTPHTQHTTHLLQHYSVTYAVSSPDRARIFCERSPSNSRKGVTSKDGRIIAIKHSLARVRAQTHTLTVWWESRKHTAPPSLRSMTYVSLCPAPPAIPHSHSHALPISRTLDRTRVGKNRAQ